MAKKKRMGRPKGTDPAKVMIRSFRGTPEFKDWFDGLVSHARNSSGWSGIPASSVIERALACLAKELGYDVPQPRR